MTFPTPTDRPIADTPTSTAPIAEPAPPIAPAAPEQSPWWSAPAGKPIGIPDFAHELRALFAVLVAQPEPVPVRVRSRRR